MILNTSCRQTLLAGSFALAAGLGGFSPEITFAADDRGVAVVEQVQGDVTLDRGGKSEKLSAGRPISRHDRLATGATARLALAFRDGSRLVLGENGALTIDDWRAEQGRTSGVLLLDLEKGAVRLTASKPLKAPDKRVELRTPVAIISVRGTDVWSGPIDSATGIIVLAGAIDVRNDAGMVLLDKQNAGTIVRDRSSAPERPRGFNADQITKAMTTVDFLK
jgi:hypothetical protein